MPKLVVTGSGKSQSFDVSDVSSAVRKTASALRKIGTDDSVLSILQTWANSGFKNNLRVNAGGQTIVVEYRN